MARIRSIKPEFWQDEKLAKLPLQARLLFIGMWTLADDGGVLRGSEMFIKSQLLPYDDNIRASEVRKWIDALVDARMLIPLQYKDESYLYVRTFRDHQKINRPSESRNIEEETLLSLLDQYDSLNIHGALTIGKGKEREKEREGDTCAGARDDPGKSNKDISFPFDSEEFRQQWDRWKSYKKNEHGFRYKSPDSEQTALNGLKKLAAETADKVGGAEKAATMIINKAISNGWKGLFQLKKEDYENNQGNNRGGLKPGGIEPYAGRTSYGEL